MIASARPAYYDKFYEFLVKPCLWQKETSLNSTLSIYLYIVLLQLQKLVKERHKPGEQCNISIKKKGWGNKRRNLLVKIEGWTFNRSVCR